MLLIVAYPTQQDYLPEKPPDESAEDPADPARGREDDLKSLYMRAVEAYRRALSGMSGREPSLTLPADPEDGTGSAAGGDNASANQPDTIIFDDELYVTLFDLYVARGWGGIARIERALREQAAAIGDEGRSGGTQVSVWGPATAFFYTTRNLLILLIRDSLLNIERLAVQDIFGRLNDTASAVAEAWTRQFAFKTEQGPPTTSLRRVGGEVVEVERPGKNVFKMGNPAFAKEVFTNLTKAVTQKSLFDETLRQIAAAKSALRGPALSGNSEIERLNEQAKNLYTEARTFIDTKAPMALLALNSLPAGFDQPQMENTLGLILNQLYLRNDELGRAIDPAVSQSAAALSSIGLTRDAGPYSVAPSAIPPEGLELFVINKALTTTEPAWFPLVSEATLHRLVQSGTIETDSFDYVVCFHYVNALIERMEALRNDEEASRKFWTSVGRVSAALSLASLVTPATAAAAAPLRAISLVADLAVMANTINSVVDQLEQLDRQLSETLVQPDALGVPALARLGQLVSMRAELIDNLGLNTAIELVLGLTPARFVRLKRLLLARGYYQDLETLLDDNQDG
jgi:hypothetical protein